MRRLGFPDCHSSEKCLGFQRLGVTGENRRAGELRWVAAIEELERDAAVQPLAVSYGSSKQTGAALKLLRRG